MKKYFTALFLTTISLFANPSDCPFKLHNVEGYWESWNPSSEPEEIAQMPSNIMNIAFAHYIQTPCCQKLVPFFGSKERGKRFIRTAHDFGKEVKLSLLFGDHRLAAKLTNFYEIDEISRSVAHLVKEMRFDGVDLCFISPVEPYLQIELIERLRTHLGIYCTISYTSRVISSVPSGCDEVLARVHPLLNSITIPSFDLGDGYRFEGTVEKLLSLDIPAEKITLGLMPGFDNFGKMTTLHDLEKAAFYVRYKNLNGIALWSLNRDHENVHGFGQDVMTNKLSELFLSPITILPIDDLATEN